MTNSAAAREERVAPNIYRTATGWRVYVRRAGVLKPKRFPAETTIAQLQTFINAFREECERLRRGPDARTPRPRGRLGRLYARATRARIDTLSRDAEGRSYLYVIGAERTVKIGRALNPHSRLKELQTGHDRALYLLAAVPCHACVERAVHARFAYLRTTGEWFRLTDELEQFVRDLQAGKDPMRWML